MFSFNVAYRWKCPILDTWNYLKPTIHRGDLISLPSIFSYLIWSVHGVMLCNFLKRPWAISMSILSATTWRWRWLETWELIWGGRNGCVFFVSGKRFLFVRNWWTNIIIFIGKYLLESCCVFHLAFAPSMNPFIITCPAQDEVKQHPCHTCDPTRSFKLNLLFWHVLLGGVFNLFIFTLTWGNDSTWLWFKPPTNSDSIFTFLGALGAFEEKRCNGDMACLSSKFWKNIVWTTATCWPSNPYWLLAPRRVGGSWQLCVFYT